MGFEIAFPYPGQLVACVGANLLQDTDVNALKNDDGLIGKAVDFILKPCDSTTLFGTDLGPVVEEQFPKVSEILDWSSNESTSEIVDSKGSVTSETYKSDKNETSGK